MNAVLGQHPALDTRAGSGQLARLSTTALVARTIELEQPGAAVTAHEGLLFGPAHSLRQGLLDTHRWLQAWSAARHPPARTALASFDGLDMLALFEPQEPQAGTGARLTLLAEVVLRHQVPAPPGVPFRSHLLAMAERCGWRLVRHEDVSAQLIAFRQQLALAVQRQRPALLAAQLDVEPAVNTLAQRLAGLLAGAHRAEVLEFERHTQPAQRVVGVAAAQSQAMQKLFAGVFKHPMSEPHWQWKYGHGRGHAVGIEEHGELVAHCGGLTRALLVFGQPEIGCQVCDVMVLPQANGSLSRQSPVYRLTASFLETYIGWGLPHAVGFGFPNRRAHGVSERLKLYVAVDSVVQMAWPALDSAVPSSHQTTAITLHNKLLGAAQRSRVDSLWQRMAAEFLDAALGVRDADWLLWRYLTHPTLQYSVTLVSSTEQQRDMGVLVTRERDDALELIDLVARPGDFGALVSLARAQAATLGKPCLRGWITRSQLHRFAHIDAAHLKVDDLAITVPANNHTSGADPMRLKDRWFLMAGDADFT